MSSASETMRVPPDQQHKATLICPSCDHTSPPAGDWNTKTQDGTEIRRCPDCGTVIERRRTFDQSPDRTEHPSPLTWQTELSRIAVAWQEFCVAQTRRLTGR